MISSGEVWQLVLCFFNLLIFAAMKNQHHYNQIQRGIVPIHHCTGKEVENRKVTDTQKQCILHKVKFCTITYKVLASRKMNVF